MLGEIMSEIGNLIYERRKELGLTLEDVGKAVDRIEELTLIPAYQKEE